VYTVKEVLNQRKIGCFSGLIGQISSEVTIYKEQYAC